MRAVVMGILDDIKSDEKDKNSVIEKIDDGFILEYEIDGDIIFEKRDEHGETLGTYDNREDAIIGAWDIDITVESLRNSGVNIDGKDDKKDIGSEEKYREKYSNYFRQDVLEITDIRESQRIIDENEKKVNIPHTEISVENGKDYGIF
jgi:hypothetical protein